MTIFKGRNPLEGTKYEAVIRDLKQKDYTYRDIAKKLQEMGYKTHLKNDKYIRDTISDYFIRFPIELDIIVDRSQLTKLSGIEDLEVLEKTLQERIKALEEYSTTKEVKNIAVDKLIADLVNKIREIRKTMVEFYKDEELKKYATMFLKSLNRIIFKLLKIHCSEKVRNAFLNDFKKEYKILKNKYNLGE